MVTDRAGFIGSHLIDKLPGEGNEVIFLDNFDNYYNPQIKRKNVEPFLENKNFQLIEEDIRDKALLKDIVRETDYIFHEAALDSNVKKIINASSSSVYGKVEYLPFDEKHPNQLVSPYIVAKLLAEHYYRAFEELYGLKSDSITINELASKIIEINKSKSEIVYTDSIKGDAENTLSSSKKAWKEIGWKPEVIIDLERYAKWISNSQL